MIFTLDALCSEKLASQWLEGRTFTVCFRTGIVGTVH